MTTEKIQLHLADEAATLYLGAALANACPSKQFALHLEGELGAGKTTLCRGFLKELGHKGNVKSPTYTLVEHYNLANRTIFHFDLYRLSSPEELDYIGLDEYMSNNALCLIEWPQQGGNYLPSPDIMVAMQYDDKGRHVEISAHSEIGKRVCGKLNN